MWYIRGLNLVILLNFLGTHVTASLRVTERKKYFIGTEEVSGIHAVEMCRRRSMKLARIRNEKENNDIYRFLKGKDLGNGLYISAKKLSNGGAFAWIDGQPLDYTNWNPGEPNGYIESESCIYVFLTKNDLKWDDIPCERPLFYLCEYGEEKECFVEHDDDSCCEHIESTKQRYYLGTEKMTYYHAIQYCENMFMQLARIRNAEENAEIYKLLLVKGTNAEFWLAANRRLGSTIWQWLDGKILTYFNWNEGEPNNIGERGIVVFKKNQETKWNDAPCGYDWFYPLCERVDPGVEIYVNEKLQSRRDQQVYPDRNYILEFFLDLPSSNYSLRWNVVEK